MQDRQEDVRTVSAEALLPVANLLAKLGGPVMLDLRRALWEVLREVDELSPATGKQIPLLWKSKLFDVPLSAWTPIHATICTHDACLQGLMCRIPY